MDLQNNQPSANAISDWSINLFFSKIYINVRKNNLNATDVLDITNDLRNQISNHKNY